MSIVNTSAMKTLSRILLSFVFLFASIAAFGQSKYVLTADQELIVFGTSTLHNWEMVTAEASGEGLFAIENGVLKSVENFKISFKGEDLESGKGIMNRNTRRALDTENTPMISFELKELKTNAEGKLEAWGDFTAKGNTRNIKFDISYKMNGDLVDVQGTTSFKLTDFKIDPLVALAGTIRTSDVVGIEFYLIFEKESTMND